MGRYAKPEKKALSSVAYIDQGSIVEIQAVVPAVSQAQIDAIVQTVNQNIDLSTKVDKVTGSALVPTTEIAKIHASGSDNQDLSNLVVKVTGSSLVADSEIAKIHASGSDNQDISNLQPKETGKGLSTNDFTTAEQTKLSGIEAGANNYTHPANHAPSVITQDASNRFVTDTEKSTWGGKEAGGAVASHESSYTHANIATAYNHSQASHAPIDAVSLAAVKGDADVASAISLKHSNSLDHTSGTDQGLDSGGANAVTAAQTKIAYTHSQAVHAPSTAQANADITKAEIEAKLTGQITTHSHAVSTWKTGIATKNINDASTTQNIAHGLGRTPVFVRVTAHAAYAAALSMVVSGSYDGTNHAGICLCSAEGTTTALIDNIYSSTVAELGFTAATGTNPYTGANRQTGVITVNGTNIIITWTKAGTVASNTVNILWEVC